MNKFAFDWSEVAFGSKKELKELKPIFVLAPRQMSSARFIQIIKQYLPQGNMLVGFAKEPFVLELEDQPQFRMLQAKDAQAIINKVNASPTQQKIYTLAYSQRDAPHILEKLPIKKVVLVNGSWYRTFHLRPEFYTLARRGTPYEMVSPFVSGEEAIAYVTEIIQELPVISAAGVLSPEEMLGVVTQVATRSFDYGGFQIGAALGKKHKTGYHLLATAHNKVVPYETFAMHHGAAREKHFSPPNDQNHYDTIHAEVALLIHAQKQQIDLKGTTLFINLLPCPSCARMLVETDIAEIVYSQDHSEGYAAHLLQGAGKVVRRAL